MTRILIADDNPQNLYLLESILKGHHFEVVSSEERCRSPGQRHSEVLRTLIIADILMPVMDGFELCRRWKADERLKQIPFIFYTATYTDPKDEQFALSLGADRFVVKPQKPEILGRIVCDVLEEFREKLPVPLKKPLGEEKEFLRQYNEVLFREAGKESDAVWRLKLPSGSRPRKSCSGPRPRYRKLYESMMDAFVRVDLAGKIQENNQSFREMLGYTDEELARLTYQDLTPEKWHAFDLFIFETQTLARGYSSVYEKEYRKKDGTVFPIELRASLIRDGTGQPSGVWAIVRDITERKRADEKIKLTNRKLALMNDVTYQDIQNKVTGTPGFCRGPAKHTNRDRNRIPFIEKESALLKSIHDLIKNTKEFQQMGVDQSRWIPLEKAIRIQFSRMSLEHDVSLVTNLNGLEIYADPLINRVFYNLLRNALQHGRKITRISFRYQETTDGIVLFCEDDGIGIPLDQKSGIFDRVVGGEGKFGLFFVREFLTLSSMTIRETGTPGEGARFEITVPKGVYRFSGEC